MNKDVCHTVTVTTGHWNQTEHPSRDWLSKTGLVHVAGEDSDTEGWPCPVEA